MDSTNFDTFDSPAGGVELSDNLNDWRKKTNGIIQKITALQAEVDSGDIDDNAVVLEKLEQIANLKVLGNTSGSSADVSEVSILDEDTFSSNSATALATQQSIKAYVDKRYISGRINANGTATSLHGIIVSRVEVGVYNVIVADSHQLPSGESYSVVAQIGVDVDPNDGGKNVINDSYHIHVFKIADIGGDPAYRVEIFELESVNGHGGGNDHNDIVDASLLRRDAQFSVIGLPATDQ